MGVVVTGATGYIGSVLCERLIERGFHVTGLARSDTAATALAGRGVAVARGSLEEPASIAEAARQADGVIHLAMSWSPHTAALDQSAGTAILDALAGFTRPFVYQRCLGHGKHRWPPGPRSSKPANLSALSPTLSSLTRKSAAPALTANSPGFPHAAPSSTPSAAATFRRPPE